MATEVTELKRRATMINDKVRMYLLPPLINAAVRAGASIMNVSLLSRKSGQVGL